MTTTIATQIRSRLYAIAAERLRLDDEERRLKKALEALTETPVETSETPGLDEAIQRLIVPMTPGLPYGPIPYPVPHYPPPMSWRDDWGITEGPQVVGWPPMNPGADQSSRMPWLPMGHTCRGLSSVVTASDLNTYDV